MPNYFIITESPTGGIMQIAEKKKQELQELQGRIFRVKERKKDTSPTHSGRLKIEGQEYWISLWVAESKESKERYFSCKLQKVAELDPIANNVNDIDDDIPF